MVVRIDADWMVHADERVLEFLDTEGPHSPSRIHADDRIRFSRQHINNRCRTLTDREMVRNIGNGVYRITELGEQYLAGELDAKTLDNDE